MDIRTISIVFSLCIPSAAAAQQDESLRPQANQEQAEEILITGKRLMLRTQMMAAEKMAYDVFNTFNDEERFHISCSIYQPTGTRLDAQICQPNFVSEATAGHARDYFENLRDLLGPYNLPDSSPAQYAPAEAVIARQQPEYRRKMRQVAQEHPEFLQALIRYSELREQYEGSSSTARDAD